MDTLLQFILDLFNNESAAQSFVADPNAALANAGAGHTMDYDDTQLSTTPDRTFGLLTHPTVPPLAAARPRGADGLLPFAAVCA